MTFTKSYFDIGGTVYYFDHVDKLPKTKENALVLYMSMICKSWTFHRMTAEEKERCINTFLKAQERGAIKGNFKTRVNTLAIIYDAFMDGIGYDGFNWRP